MLMQVAATLFERQDLGEVRHPATLDHAALRALCRTTMRCGWRGSLHRVVASRDSGRGNQAGQTAFVLVKVEPMTGIEPAYSAWEADVLPLNYIGVRVPDSRTTA